MTKQAKSLPQKMLDVYNQKRMMGVNVVVSDGSFRNPQLSIQSLTVRTYSYGFVYLSKKSRVITKIKDYVCAERAKVQGKSGPRKVIDPPSLGRRTCATSRSIRRTAKADHTNPELRPERRAEDPFRQGKRVCLEYGSDSFSRGVEKRLWRGLLYLFQVYSIRPEICTI